MSPIHRKSGAPRRVSADGRSLPPLGSPTSRISLDADMSHQPTMRPGTAVQNFAMGKVQAVLQPMLEAMFVSQPTDPVAYITGYLTGENADGAQRMDSLMQELDSATEKLDTARMRILELEQQLAAAAPPVVVQGEFSAADQEVQAAAAKTLRRARSHFDKADIDGSGDLEGDELKEVAAWVIKSFTPDGDTKPLDDAAINAEVAKLLRSADANNDGKISFKE